VTAPTPDVPAGHARDIFDLRGRVAVVSGAGSGLGAAMAVGFAQVGVSVYLADIDPDGVATTAALIEAQGGAATALPLDVTSAVAVEAAAARVVEETGRLDVLVNSAGTAYRAPAEAFPEDRFDAIIALNLKGTYLCCQSFGRHMLAQRSGSIINVGSIGSHVAYPWASAYLASKGGVLQLTRALALEWADRDVRVNAIGPTLMQSPLTASAEQASSVTADFIRARMLRNRLGRPRDLIGAAIFLASDASALVTGHTLMCDDGYLTA
jgi:NAD(P)-dependent dehydrogenase (short-subunit alcohol dehydrogenase family)